jgi:hypothetical protein
MEVGSLVECVNGNFEHKQIELIANRPKQGKIYTVRLIKQYPSNKIGVLLEEIVNEALILPNLDGLFEPTFDINRFREVQEGSIEELTEILELENTK